MSNWAEGRWMMIMWCAAWSVLGLSDVRNGLGWIKVATQKLHSMSLSYCLCLDQFFLIYETYFKFSHRYIHWLWSGFCVTWYDCLCEGTDRQFFKWSVGCALTLQFRLQLHVIWLPAHGSTCPWYAYQDTGSDSLTFRTQSHVTLSNDAKWSPNSSIVLYIQGNCEIATSYRKDAHFGMMSNCFTERTINSSLGFLRITACPSLPLSIASFVSPRFLHVDAIGFSSRPRKWCSSLDHPDHTH